MPKKSLIFGGLFAASASVLTPSGIYIHRKKEAKRARKIFINQASSKADELNGDAQIKANKMLFLKESDDQDLWKLMWINEVLYHYAETSVGVKKYNISFKYTSEEMNKYQQTYWEEIISKQKEDKWKGKITNKRLQQANEKNQYWEKFKEICLIFMKDDLIDKSTNINPSYPTNLLCVWSETSLKESLDEYKKITNPNLGIMEYHWTVYFKAKRTPNK